MPRWDRIIHIYIKTWWNSLIAVIKGFLKHTNLIRKLMLDFEYDYSFSNNDIKRLYVLVRVFELLEIALKRYTKGIVIF